MVAYPNLFGTKGFVVVGVCFVYNFHIFLRLLASVFYLICTRYVLWCNLVTQSFSLLSRFVYAAQIRKCVFLCT
jgi:hypothetical protein